MAIDTQNSWFSKAKQRFSAGTTSKRIGGSRGSVVVDTQNTWFSKAKQQYSAGTTTNRSGDISLVVRLVVFERAKIDTQTWLDQPNSLAFSHIRMGVVSLVYKPSRSISLCSTTR